MTRAQFKHHHHHHPD
ncbi:his operon leader peptide [Citrobacter freundii]|uniref:his operon leader peptide n=10 Tax=Citrobacter TaxID=544 RepID=A0A2S4Q9K8_CITFR|nr:MULTISPECIES: his operon leader peptide [Citrobacter]EBF7093702.1 his operon leader peptide [Salmonella enterica subsp. enterica serovar Liverpool]EJG2170013.1 his operon leader peptide [Citrobacter freundii 47N]KAE9751374.1 his operon leader peptide [Enterobacteriaceae bacterium TzEc058]MBA7795194.1 his operon leader peptide [Citrobacter sp. RHBSTW-01065]MBD0805732.1 his operon leader peptide [Citrobacter sp. C13]MBJ3558456.1 his operon leader peptide [Salmonella enterica subsp. enterica 